jgi:hypothetical protein
MNFNLAGRTGSSPPVVEAAIELVVVPAFCAEGCGLTELAYAC